MKIRSIALAALLVVAACETTTTDTPAVEATPTTLPEAEFNSLYNAAYNSNPRQDSERAYAALLARDDLTDNQRGRTYLGRALTRGVWVRDWAEAYPQCALGDLMTASEYPLSDGHRKQLFDQMIYQYYRSHYFPLAPTSCMENLEAAQLWLEANDPCARRDDSGKCISSR